MYRAIEEARGSGYDDDDILSFMMSKNPDLERSSQEALKSGYTSSQILDYISATSREGKKLKKIPKGQVLPKQEYGFGTGFQRGFQRGTLGLVTGAEEQLPREEGFLEHLGVLGGETVSDLPAMFAGGAAGGLAGGAVGGPIGGVLGGGAGAFATPAVIKQAFAEYRGHVRQGLDLTFGEFLERVGRVGATGLKSGIVGAATSQAARLLPVLRNMPGLKKLLSSRAGKAVEKPLATLTAITGAQTVTEGRIPSLREIGDNVAVMLGFHLTTAGLGKIRSVMKKKGVSVQEAVDDIGRETLKKAEKKPEPVRVEPPKLELKKSEDPRKILEESIDRLPKTAQKAARKILEIKDKFKREQSYFKILREHVEKTRSGQVESQFKWRDTFAEAEKKYGKRFTPKQREEMIYYRQKTGNPNIKGDTFDKLSERLPKEAKEVVKVVEKHTDAWLERWNENPVTKKISPREGLEEIYLPGLYEEPKGGYDKVLNLVSKQFKVKNPFSNQKTFINYHEALIEAGLKPKFKDLGHLMQAYDEIMLRLEANNELLDHIHKIEKESKSKLIVNSGDGKLYNMAKKGGWIPFHDVFLRNYVTGTTKEGKPIHATYASPALMHPDMAPAMKGMFQKDAFKPEHKLFQWYDVANDILKTFRVTLSPFHYVALSESGFGALGLDLFKALPEMHKLFPKNWWDEGARLRADKDFMIDAAKYVEVGRLPDHEQIRHVETMFTRVLDKLPKKMIGINLNPVYDTILRANKFLFNEYQPRLKLYTWKTYVDEALVRHAEKGIEITPEVLKEIKRDCGSLVNNQFGGQIKEMSRIFNDPKQRRWVQRAVGYFDWTVSAAKQAAGFFGKGIKGDMAREYWVRYGIGFLASTAIMKFIMGGFQSKDDEPNKVRWNPERALKAWDDEDPTKWLAFPLPDMKLKVGEVEFNPGRDEKGRKRYSHFGKQALEIPRYFTNFTDALFSKSSPLIQETFKQVAGSTPYQGESFPVRGAWINGNMRPWDGTMKGTPKRLISRGKAVIGAFVPFGLRTIAREGGDKWVEGLSVWASSGLGAVPVGKGMSLRKAEPYIYDALLNRNMSKLNKVVRVLKENGYKMPQIKKTIKMTKKFHLDQKKASKK